MSNDKKHIASLSKTLQVFFPPEKMEEYHYCLSTITLIQSNELSKGNNCRKLDALYIMCKKYMEELQ